MVVSEVDPRHQEVKRLKEENERLLNLLIEKDERTFKQQLALEDGARQCYTREQEALKRVKSLDAKIKSLEENLSSAKGLNMHSRDELIQAINNYAKGSKEGTETLGNHPAWTALCIALDRYEGTFLDRIKDLEKTSTI
jgi:DNA repair ATPase RecN